MPSTFKREAKTKSCRDTLPAPNPSGLLPEQEGPHRGGCDHQKTLLAAALAACTPLAAGVIALAGRKGLPEEVGPFGNRPGCCRAFHL